MDRTLSVLAVRGRRGFTLIELLVVIAIIALLAAILFPAFAAARERARLATCQSNLKQIGLGILQYSQDYDEHFPFGFWGQGLLNDGDSPRFSGNVGVGGNPPYFGWNDLILPYISNTQVYICPDQAYKSNGNLETTPFNGAIPYGNPSYTALTPPSYSMNLYLSDLRGNFDVYASSPGISVTQIRNPALCLMATETVCNYQSDHPQYHYLGAAPMDVTFGFGPALTGLQYTDLTNYRTTYGGGPGAWNGDPTWYNNGIQGDPVHGLGTVRNVLYCDGHVKTLQIYAPGVTFARQGTPYTGTAISVCSPYGSTACQLSTAVTWCTEAYQLWAPSYG